MGITPEVDFLGVESVVWFMPRGPRILVDRVVSKGLPVILSTTYPRIWKASLE